MRSGTCRLCLTSSRLAYSHVYPEFFYAELYDSSHCFISVTSHPRQPVRPFQKGFREFLLCQRCESQFSRYESYAASILRQVAAIPTQGKRHVEIFPFDYSRFKLFGLSLIWRCHISSIHTFGSVKLGSHAKKIRQMLLDENPGKPNQYGFVVIKIGGTTVADSVLLPPAKTKFGGIPSYFATAMGYQWVFIMSNPFLIKPAHYPVVGLQPNLLIPVYYQTDEGFLGEMKLQLQKSALDKLMGDD